jgi:hypothetical protein
LGSFCAAIRAGIIFKFNKLKMAIGFDWRFWAEALEPKQPKITLLGAATLLA